MGAGSRDVKILVGADWTGKHAFQEAANDTQALLLGIKESGQRLNPLGELMASAERYQAKANAMAVATRATRMQRVAELRAAGMTAAAFGMAEEEAIAAAGMGLPVGWDRGGTGSAAGGGGAGGSGGAGAMGWRTAFGRNSPMRRGLQLVAHQGAWNISPELGLMSALLGTMEGAGAGVVASMGVAVAGVVAFGAAIKYQLDAPARMNEEVKALAASLREMHKELERPGPTTAWGGKIRAARDRNHAELDDLLGKREGEGVTWFGHQMAAPFQTDFRERMAGWDTRIEAARKMDERLAAEDVKETAKGIALAESKALGAMDAAGVRLNSDPRKAAMEELKARHRQELRDWQEQDKAQSGSGGPLWALETRQAYQLAEEAEKQRRAAAKDEYDANEKMFDEMGRLEEAADKRIVESRQAAVQAKIDATMQGADREAALLAMNLDRELKANRDATDDEKANIRARYGWLASGVAGKQAAAGNRAPELLDMGFLTMAPGGAGAWSGADNPKEDLADLTKQGNALLERAAGLLADIVAKIAPLPPVADAGGAGM